LRDDDQRDHRKSADHEFLPELSAGDAGVRVASRKH
jgi:hypothetical protein